MKRVLLAFASLIVLGFIAGCSLEARSGADPSGMAMPEKPAMPPERLSEPTSVPLPPPPPPELRVTLMAVGDIMVHQEQLDAAWDKQSQTYNFAPFFRHVTSVLQQGDWVVGNLETTLAGSEKRYTGYPQFNTPESLAATLRQVGFTALTTANNHSLDRREAGVIRTLDELDKAGLKHTGTFRTPEERDQPLMLEKNGIRLGMVAYTYGTNGIPLPQGKPYLVNLIDPALIKRDIVRAKERGADLVAVALHFGAEYQRLPNEAQKKLADDCIRYGADLVIGHHPHVVQPYEWRTVTDEAGVERTGLVAYSLGNFISAQRGDFKDVGAILKVTFHKQGEGTAKIESAQLMPTYVHFYRTNGKRNYVIYPLEATLASTGTDADGVLTDSVRRKMEQLYRQIERHVSSFSENKQPG